ncbi:MAG: aminotransferase class V-fold PLP-dependent enzyme [Chloroflexi bacterium]|nr:aminotransferase class V-fold PLP-dependent enzyme [Chloroflexota bacterium]
MNIETLAVHAGRPVENHTGAVTPSITLSTTFERAEDGSFPHGNIYTRSGNPNRAALQEALAALEGGESAFAFASGMAAAAAILQTLSADDHVILSDDLYHGVRYLTSEVLARWNLQTSFVDMSDPENIRAALRPYTRLVWVETPTNPALKIVDITAAAEIARAAGALTVVDNTWATPVWQLPLALGADIVMHSTTKYLGGHSDVLGGALVLRSGLGELSERIATVQNLSGAVPSPFDCWLILRSLPTLPIRVRAQTESAGKVAQFLADHAAVERVHYPGLPDHDNHAVAARQMRGFGGMLSFQVRGGKDAAMQVAARVSLFTRATSLGGIESLIEHRASVEGPTTATPQNLLRVSIGLEHPDDLIADLRTALE